MPFNRATGRVPTQPTQSEAPQFLSIAECQDVTGLSRATFTRAIRAGVLPVHEVGLGTVRPRVRIALPDLVAFVAPRPALRAQTEAHQLPEPRTPRRTDKGFTLIELLVVVIIIGILSGIAIPVFLGQKARASEAAVQADLKHLASAAETWWDGHDSYPTDTAGWTAANPPSAGVTIRAFTSNSAGGQAGYIIYGKHVRAGTRVWVLSSWGGGVPTKTALTALPDVPPSAGQLGVPAGASWQSWAMVGGTDWGHEATTRNVLAWFDPSLQTVSKLGTDTNSLGGFDGHMDSLGTETPWTTVAVTDAPVAGRAARFVVGASDHDWGMQLSPWSQGTTPPPLGVLTAGTAYTVSVWINAPAGTPLNVSARVQTPSWVWIATAVNTNITTTGGWQRVTASVVATPAWATGNSTFAITVRTLRGGTADPGTVVLVTAPQIDIGPVATPFQAQVPGV
ncbi:prepilin-type N-terminal cleavage/methylation domain-containing protein [Cellulomonas sp. JH27-2]|uniref:prepilin-type N-terminal cleavage/methylation domain-containing protein n=1 Tax=Cellulomonas sp. JH27-2 TaxID=2774139 RepID=UPI001783AEA0|nr:prepilin-type N-terminal cleavage/methylation domain-containing protein [Cellulomonas sp. JH27-2]MBD8059024.1 prepilin-type N-terminal cleavage/methylation domain-containing protein [Cellulomonas sp. JH27-2]